MIKFTPDRLTKKTIWDITEDFRSNHKYALQLPVKVEELIEFNLGIEIRPVTGLRLSCEVEAFLSKNLRTIFVDRKAYDNNSYLRRLRFTLAEEVGHYVLHGDIYKHGAKYESEEEFIKDIINMDGSDLHWVEYQARQFAGRLLVPHTELEKQILDNHSNIKEFYKKYDGNDDMKDFVIEGVSKIVCDHFEVSYEVIRARIYHEKFEHYFKI